MPRFSYSTIASCLALGFALLHLAIAPWVDLSVDEAHYGLYARFIDWSYYDHPPLVGWLLYLLTPLGLNEFTLRLPSALIYLACCQLLYSLSASDLEGGTPRRGLLAVTLFSLMPMVQLLGFGLIPEVPLLLIALLLVKALRRLEANDSPLNWMIVGLLLGLAGLTKYTAVLLVLGLGLYWLLCHRIPRIFLLGGFWLAVLTALATVSPVIYWNVTHDWASFSYQIHHAAGGDWELLAVLRAFAVQWVVYTPLVLVALVLLVRDIRIQGPRQLLACLALPVFLFVTLGSGNGKSLPHWVLLCWSLLLPSLSHWIDQNWSRRWPRLFTGFSVGLCLFISLTIMGLLAFKPLGKMPWAAPALQDLVGWREAAQKAQRLRREQFGDDGVLLVSNWSRASRIAWYAWPSPVQVLSSRPGQFEAWYGLPDTGTRGILIRDNPDEDDHPTRPVRKQGLECHYLADDPARVEQVTVNHFWYYRCGP